MMPVVPENVHIAGMGDNANHTAFLLLAPDNVTDSGEGRWNVDLDVFLPAFVFIHKFLFRKAIPFAAHIRKTQMAAAVNIFFQRNGGTGAELVEDVDKKGIIDGCFTLNDGIIVVQDKTGVF